MSVAMTPDRVVFSSFALRVRNADTFFGTVILCVTVAVAAMAYPPFSVKNQNPFS
jgi:hypothetical protein